MTANPFAKSVNPTPLQHASVSKRLTPGQNGTKRLQAEYGNALVCVRYRLDGRKRYTTVELVIDEQELPPPATRRQDIVAVTIGRYPVMDISTNRHPLPYMDMPCPYMATRLTYVEVVPTLR